MHTAILQWIMKQLLTLAMEFLNKNYWAAGPSLYFPHQKTRGLRKLYWRHLHSWGLRQKKSLRKRNRRWSERGRPGIHSNLVGMASTEATQVALIMILKSLKPTPQFWLELLKLTHPVASIWARRLAIYDNPLPQAWSDNPKNWTLPLTEISPIIAIWRPFLAR